MKSARCKIVGFGPAAPIPEKLARVFRQTTLPDTDGVADRLVVARVPFVKTALGEFQPEHETARYRLWLVVDGELEREAELVFCEGDVQAVVVLFDEANPVLNIPILGEQPIEVMIEVFKGPSTSLAVALFVRTKVIDDAQSTSKRLIV